MNEKNKDQLPLIMVNSKRKALKKRSPVICTGCAFLCFVQGLHPICLVGGNFIHGPLRKRIDLRGIAEAERVNQNNNCKKKKRISIKALKFRSWLKKDCKRKGMKYYGGSLKRYRIREEKQYKTQGKKIFKSKGQK